MTIYGDVIDEQHLIPSWIETLGYCMGRRASCAEREPNVGIYEYDLMEILLLSR